MRLLQQNIDYDKIIITVLEVWTVCHLGKELPGQGEEASIHTCKRQGGRKKQTLAARHVTAPLS